MNRRNRNRSNAPFDPVAYARAQAERLGLPAADVARLVGSAEAAARWLRLGRRKKRNRIRYLLRRRADTLDSWRGFEETRYDPGPAVVADPADRNRAEAAEAALWEAGKDREELRKALSRRTDMRAESPALRDDVGGRTALSKYGRNVVLFANEVNEVPVVASLTEGPSAGEFMLTRAGAVFEVMMAAEPRSEAEGRRRALAEHLLTHTPLRRVLAEPSAAGEAARRIFFGLFLRSGIDTVSSELLRRSGEMGIRRGEGSAERN